MTTEKGQMVSVGSGALVRHLFERIPHGRDEHGNVHLYPGMPRYVGVAGFFSTPHGEIVVLAPTIDALDDQVRYLNLAGELIRERCAITEARRVPNT